jgi:hypothetical protein
VPSPAASCNPASAIPAHALNEAAPGGSGRHSGSRCHAEGRGFESHHPLFETRWKTAGFLMG